MKNPFLFLVLLLFSITLSAQSIISSSSTFTQNDADGLSWPIVITGGTISSPVVVTLAENISLTASNQYFSIESEYVEFDGNNYSFTLNNVSDYPGLMQNGTSSSYGYSNVSVKKTRVLSNSAVLLTFGGWIGQTYFGYGASNVAISNCFSDGYISSFGGGITGSSSSCTVTGSHSSGYTGDESGGICGAYFDGSVTNCYSTGDIYVYGGGICGYNGSGSIANCYSAGAIDNYAGGICGAASYGTITNSYSRGNIAAYGGGIAGDWFSGSIDNCSSTGAIGSNAGGMVGEDNYGLITNCYTSGLVDPNGNGITYNNAGTITNCFAEGTGAWNDANTYNILTGTAGSSWTDVEMPSDDVPYKLSSFNESIYSPDNASVSEGASSGFTLGNFTTGNYSIISITGNPAGYSSLTIDAGTGMVSVSTAIAGSYVVKILYMDNSDGSYQINNFTLDVLSTLPVTWRSFTVTPRGNSAWIQWSTSSEQNTRDFNVQHSINGSNWTTIATVTAAGNSTSISNYSYLHADPVKGTNYYRIQQADRDDKYTYSSIRQLQVASINKSFSIINTVVNNGVLRVEVKASSMLSLYTNDGKLLWQKKFNAGIQNIDLSNVSKGVYFLKGKDAAEKIVVQ